MSDNVLMVAGSLGIQSTVNSSRVPKTLYVQLMSLNVLMAALSLGIQTTTVNSKNAMECPDGSAVGRDPENDCEFFECTDGGHIWEFGGCP